MSDQEQFNKLRMQLVGKTIADIGATYTNDDEPGPVLYGSMEFRLEDNTQLSLDTSTRRCPCDCSVYITAQLAAKQYADNIRFTETGVIVPTVHLNGTNKNDLAEQCYNSYRSIGDAITTLSQNGPNARDYYVQGNEAYRIARDQHVNRLKRLEALQAELLSIFEGVDDQRTRK